MSAEHALRDLVQFPSKVQLRRAAWQKMTSGRQLFDAVQDAVRANRGVRWSDLVDELQRWRDEWVEFPGAQLAAPFETVLNQWHAARRLIWCGSQAVTRREGFETPIDRACRAIAEQADVVDSDAAWESACVCIRTLLGGPAHSVSMPVALWNEARGPDGGVLAILALDALKAGAGQIAHHPADVFATTVGPEFMRAMTDAWRAAHSWVGADAAEAMRDGRWRLLCWNAADAGVGNEQTALESVEGRSAAGAATWGWWFALKDQDPGEGIILLADVSEDPATKEFQLIEIAEAGIKAKTRAIAKSPRIDTIVVAPGNQQHVEDELSSQGRPFKREEQGSLVLFRLLNGSARPVALTQDPRP